jgi:AmmeMemoRadiSam system protein B
MTTATEARLPRLRAVDVHPVAHGGRVSLLLRDPLQLSDKAVAIPQQLAPLLALCDGTRDASGLRAALGIRFGLRVGPGTLEQLLVAFDEALLLDNDRFAEARERALVEYRQAPFRPPALAGKSYPDDADELQHVLRGYLDAVEDVDPAPDDGRGLVSPHIDYARGGPVYARVWKRAAETVKAAELVVLLGTDHFGEDDGLALTRQHYGTPFGVLPTSREVVDALADAVGVETDAFAGELYHRSEHSIELAAVWLHYVREGKPCELVPILCGSFGHFMQSETEPRLPEQDPAINALVDTLRQKMAGRRVLVVASGDLSHVGPAFGGRPQGLIERARLQAADEELIERICTGDAQGFFAAVEREGNRRNVCGLPPIYLALRVLSPVQGEQVAYHRCPADQDSTSLVTICGILLK